MNIINVHVYLKLTKCVLSDNNLFMMKCVNNNAVKYEVYLSLLNSLIVLGISADQRFNIVHCTVYIEA